MGMHGATTAPLAFTDCEVPAENLLRSEGWATSGAKTLTRGRHDRRGAAASWTG
jgi:alkylation response protein AidB-like acyl-CoA dehydrogenase